MATRIRLRRVGRKKQAVFRIVVAGGVHPRDGRITEAIGKYNPRTHPAFIEIDEGRALYWLRQGAQASESVRALFRKAGIMRKFAEGAEGEGVVTIGDGKGKTVLAVERARPKPEGAKPPKAAKAKPAKPKKAEAKAEAAPEAAAESEPEEAEAAAPEAEPVAEAEATAKAEAAAEAEPAPGAESEVEGESEAEGPPTAELKATAQAEATAEPAAETSPGAEEAEAAEEAEDDSDQGDGKS